MFRAQKNNDSLLVAVIAIGILLFASVLHAQLDDPTLPPNVGSIVSKKVEQDTGWKLTSVLISPQRSVAIINDQHVKVGDTLSGARVQSINETGVKLRYRGEIIRLELYPVTVKTVHEE